MNPWSLAIASLIWSNHNINFIFSSMKAFVPIYYITNYATKQDYSQYQRIMAIAIVKKLFEEQDKPGLESLSYTPTLDKCLLKSFNRLSHNCEVSRPSVARFLLDLSNHYTPNAPMKSNNISMLKI